MDEARAHLRAIALAVAGMMLLLMVLKRYARRRGLATLGQSPLRRRRERGAAPLDPPSEVPGRAEVQDDARADAPAEASR